MYSYQHRYHAGNIADLQKHTVLYAILEAFHAKPAPFAVLDAFAGEGVYDLSSHEAQKTGEHKIIQGIAPELPYYESLSAIAASYGGQAFKEPYAGSPAIIKAALRPQDRAIFIENHPQAHRILEETFSGDSRLTIQKRDAYQALATLLPLHQPRGLVLIDPSYEMKDEYAWVPEALARALKKYRQGVFMVWYPLLSKGRHEEMVKALMSLSCPNVWRWDWCVRNPSLTDRLYGTGVLVLNLPYAAQIRLNPFRDTHGCCPL